MKTLTTERVKAIATLAVTLFSTVNAGLALAGINTLPFTSDQVSAAVYGVLSVVTTFYAWWKNQNLTSAAVVGQQTTSAIKANAVKDGGTTTTVTGATAATDTEVTQAFANPES